MDGLVYHTVVSLMMETVTGIILHKVDSLQMWEVISIVILL